MKNYKILITSSCFFLFPLFYVNFFAINPPIYEKYLSFLLTGNFVLSSIFWHNPRKRSLIHKLDAFLVRFSVLCIVFYIFFIKEIECQYKFLFYVLYLLFVVFARISNRYSTKEWCSNHHITIHFIMHLIGIFGSYIAFI